MWMEDLEEPGGPSLATPRVQAACMIASDLRSRIPAAPAISAAAAAAAPAPGQR